MSGSPREQGKGPGGREGRAGPCDEWVVVLPGSAPVVLAATELGRTDCDDDDRCSLYGVSEDPAVVAECGRLLGL